jgi:hypothetical protein
MSGDPWALGGCVDRLLAFRKARDWELFHRPKELAAAIAIEAGESPVDVAAFVKEYGLGFSVWPDPSQKALEAFRNNALPNSYLIDRSDVVRLAWSGAISREMLEKYVTPLLED